jgi:hypothetical protein
MKVRLVILLLAGVVSCAPTRVERHSWVTGLKPEKASCYRKLHANPWPSVNARLKECNVSKFMVYERTSKGRPTFSPTSSTRGRTSTLT